MATAKIGDIFEITTVKGLAYAQYTHENKLMGGLIRVFDRIYDARPNDFKAVVHGAVRFSTFLPVRQAVKQKIFLVVANEEVSAENMKFPLFRASGLNPNDWWLWDGEKEWQVGTLSSEQKKLPIREVCNDTYLIERIEGVAPEASSE